MPIRRIEPSLAMEAADCETPRNIHVAMNQAEEISGAAPHRPPGVHKADIDETCGGEAELRRQIEIIVSEDPRAG